jgi:ferredoxin-NADP reductase
VPAFTADVAHVEDLTHDVRVIELRLRDPAEILFQAGQFVSFHIDKEGLRFPLTRVYSIVSSLAWRNSIELLFNRVPEGPGSSYLFSLNRGDTVQFDGPAGTFVLHDYPDRDLLS